MNSTTLKQMTKDETDQRSQKSHINQRRILWSVRTQNFVLFFVHKIVSRDLSVVHVFLWFVVPQIFIVWPICERK